MFTAITALTAPIPGLFNTGVDNNRVALANGLVDPHYRIVQSPDVSFPGPDARVVTDTQFPIGGGPWLPTTAQSKWIGPQANQSTGNQAGDYRYRITFDLSGLEANTPIITGRWSSDNNGLDILLNGASTGNANAAQFAAWTSFTLSADSGHSFLPGLNTLDFVVNNAGPGVNPTGFRAEVSGVAATPQSPPSIIAHPLPRVVSMGDTVAFEVTALASHPLSYQWRRNGGALAGATNRILTLHSVTTNEIGNYDVVVSNPWGSVTSQSANLRALLRLGPSSRRTGLVFSEIMYHPKARTDLRNLEFVEIHNTNPYEEDVSGYRITGDWDFTFPSNTFVPGDGFLVVAPVPSHVQTVYGITGVLGGFTNNLPNDSGRLRLRKKSGAIVLQIDYADEAPWPVAADGSGHSLVLTQPWFGENNPRSWSHSALVGGTPGVADPAPTGPLEGVVINEILAQSAEPQLDFIELYNHTTNTVNISGCYLSDDPATNKFRILDGTILAPGTAVAFDQVELGFGLSADGDEVFFVTPSQNRVIDALRFGGQEVNTALGRFPDGAPTLHRLASPTPDLPNTPLLIGPVVINEIMYNPISGEADDEYVELFNRSASPINVGGWRFVDGIDFAIPAGLIIPALGYLVVAENATHLMTNYPNLHMGNVVGDFSGRLDDGGEHIALARPITRFTTNESNGFVTTNTFFAVVSEVTYGDGGRWGKWSDGGGSSLELTDPRADGRLAANWADSDETAKAEWTLVDFTGAMDNGSGAADRLDVLLQGKGEALLDNLEVVPATGGNRIANGAFEAGVAGWILQGTHKPSQHATEGYESSRSLRVIASERGDHVANHARTPITPALTTSGNATIRAKVRWLRGHPEMLFRVKGGYLEAVARLNVPSALGTPGAANSQFRQNAGPAITEVMHSPVLPQAGQPIVVTTRLHDPDGMQSVTLQWRQEPTTGYAPVTMVDNGLGADELAQDGIYTGVIPARAAGAMVGFYLQATDSHNVPSQSRFPTDAPARECLVRVGEISPAGAFGAYHLWLSQSSLSNWTSSPIMSNHDIDGTFVYGNRHAVYNVGTHFSGSSYTAGCYNSPIDAISGYDINLPDDQALLGATHFTLDFLIRDPTGQREQLQYWFLEQFGLPNMHRRYVHMIVNGIPQTARSAPCGGATAIYEDVQQPSGEAIEEWFSDDADGDLYKTDCWDEFSDAGVRETGCIALNTLQNFTTTGGARKVARYRWNWRPRATDGTANDFATLFDLVDAANAPTPAYQSGIECLVDVPNWMRTFAMNDISSFWDAFGNRNGKNTYLYKPEREGWKLFSWDFDVGLGTGHADSVTIAENPLFQANDAMITRMVPQTHAWTRLYYAAIAEAVNGFFRVGSGMAIDRLLDARYTAFVESGIGLTSPDVIKTWITGRRNALLGELNAVNASYAMLSSTSITTSNNLVAINGTAPVTVHSITVNGIAYPITWTALTAWRILVPVHTASTNLTVEARDRSGNVIAGTARTVTVNFTGAHESTDAIVINEIMYNPIISESSFVELFNTSSNYSFDLSGWRINGMGYTFPAGAIITNRQYLVVTKDRAAFGAAYGWNIPAVCEFDGQLDNGGETLTLLQPVAQGSSTNEVVIDRVTYDDDPPWPAAADGQGYSLQLIDAAQDNDRVSNWADGQGWRFFQYTRTVGVTTNSRISFFFESSGGDLYLDDISFVAGTVPGVGSNLIANGDFESPFTPPWNVTGIATNSAITTAVAHSGNSSLHYIQNPGGASLATFYHDMSPITTGTVYTLSFWFLSGDRGTNFRCRLNTMFDTTASTRSIRATPGAANLTTVALPAFPGLWISEVHPSPGLLDNAGDTEPWLELFYSGLQPLPLEQYYLSDNFSNLVQWPFPADAAINPQEYLVLFSDGEPSETAGRDWHTSFRLTPGAGTIVLSRLVNGSPQIIDYLNYSGIGPSESYGAYPGQSSLRRIFHYPSPRGTNDPTRRPAPVFINEWMASNGGVVTDPADGDPNDWFELYNAGLEPIDLGGYTITDDRFDTNKHTIPRGFVIPPRGFLLVWADEESGQSDTNGDLHVEFRLGAGGEEIALYEPGGRLIDLVEFEGQTTDVSEGRYPDGAAGPFVSMPMFTPRAANRLGPQHRIRVISVSGADVTLTWDSLPGRTYRVQYQPTLDETGPWLDVPGDVGATGASTSKTDFNTGGASQRFYRLLVVE